MNEREDQDKDIRDALRMSVSQEEPSEELMRNLRLMAHKASAPKRAWWQSRFAVAATAGAAVLMVATLTMIPSKAQAKTFQSLVNAAEKVHSFRFSIDSSEGGKRERLTIAGIDGRVAMQTSDGELMQVEPEGLTIYDPNEKKVMKVRFGKFAGAQQMMKQIQSGIETGLEHMDLKQMLREYEAKYGKDHIVISPVRNDGAHNVYDVTFAAPSDPERVKLTVDSTTDLPYRIVADKQKDGRWVTETTIDMSFGEAIDPSLLEVRFPSNVKVEEIDLEKVMKGAMGGAKDMESMGKEMGSMFEHMDFGDSKPAKKR